MQWKKKDSIGPKANWANRFLMTKIGPTNQPTQMLPEINISQQKNQEPQEIFAN